MGNNGEFTCTLASGLSARITVNTIKDIWSLYLGPDLILAEPAPPQVTKRWLLIKARLMRSGKAAAFGLGETTLPLNKAGQNIPMYNLAQPGYGVGAKPLYQSYPLVVFQYDNGPACGLVFDNPAYCHFAFMAWKCADLKRGIGLV